MKKILKFWIFVAFAFAFFVFYCAKEEQGALAVFFIVLFIFLSIILCSLARKYYADENAVSVELLDESEIITKQAEKTGFSIHYHGNISTSQHYQYKDVVTGYRCTFLVKYENGKERKVKCRHGDAVYQKLCKVNGIEE